MTLGKWFSELRSWFDHNHCQPTLFNQSERVIGKLLFNITFSDEAKSRLFSSTFVRYAPFIGPTASALGEREDGPDEIRPPRSSTGKSCEPGEIAACLVASVG